MKIFITITMMLILSAGMRAQSTREPSYGEFKLFCDEIGLELPGPTGFKAKTGFQYNYEKKLWDIARVDPNIDTIETARPKIQKFWNKYKHKFVCNEGSFPIPSGSLLKFAVHRNFKDLMETLVMSYNLDINFIDISDTGFYKNPDGRNVIDYMDDEIKRINSSWEESYPNEYAKKLKEYRDSLIQLGAKTGAEVRKEKNWTAEDHFKKANALPDITNSNFYNAVNHYNKAIEINPNFADAYVALARLLLSESDNSAITELTTAIELKPSNIEAYTLRATNYCRLGKKAEAAADEKKVIELGGKLEKKCQ